MNFKWKKQKKNWLSILLAICMLLSQSQVGIVFAQDTNGNAEEQMMQVQTESEGDTSENQSVVQYVAVDKAYISQLDTQKIVVGIDNIDMVLSEAYLVIENEQTGETQSISAGEINEESIVFNAQYDPSLQAAQYLIKGIELVGDGSLKYDLSELGIDAKFGVGMQIETTPDAVTVDSESSDVSVEVLKIGDESSATEEEIVSAMQEAAEDTSFQNNAKSAKKENVVIVLDPGHDDTHAGTQKNGYSEEDLTLKIASYCKAELEKYSGVTVYMTRSTSACPFPGTSSLNDNIKRTEFAASVGADFYVSIHLNSGPASASGVEVYYPNSNYNAAVGAAGKDMAEKVLNELVKLGLANRGTKLNADDAGNIYPDGSQADDYTVIKRNKLNGIPAIIVEHAFLSNTADVNNFLNSEAKLQKLGAADAVGIASYFGLQKKQQYNSSNVSLECAADTTGTVYTISAKTMPDAYSAKIAVWSETNGQDDLIWYNATKNSDGSWTVKVPISNHNSTGEYNAHLYVFESDGSGYFVNGTTFDVKGASLKELSVQNANLSAGTFDVKISGVSAVTGIGKVKVAAWTKADQSDLYWYTATKQSDGNYKATVNIANHKYNYGNYQLHVYITDMIGIESFGMAKSYKFVNQSTWEAACGGTTEYVNLVNAGYGTGIVSMKFAVWSEKNGQDDLIWYTAYKDSEGKWVSAIPLGNHKTSGKYQVHAYATLKNGETRCLNITSFEISEAKAGGIAIANAQSTEGTFDVKISGVSAATGVGKVRVAAWTKKDQSDLYWYTAMKQSDGTYKATVDTANHKYNYGDYQLHVYITDMIGIESFGTAKSYQFVNQSTWEAACGGTTEYVNLVNAGYGTGIVSMKFAVWSEKNGQDDLIWYTAYKDSEGKWVSAIPLGNHKTSGKYQVHAYATLKNGETRCLNVTSFSIGEPKVSRIAVSDANKEKGTFTVTVSGVSAATGIGKVRVAAWTKADQSDLYWYTATKQLDGNYKATVDIANNKYNYGTYQLHAYVTDGIGIESFGTAMAYQFVNQSIWEAACGGTTEYVNLVNAGYGTGIVSMKFAVWSEKNGQDDLIWYTAYKDSEGKWVSAIPLGNHKTSGKYQVHAYATLKNGETRCLNITSFSINGPKASEVSVSTRNEDAGTFSVKISGLTSEASIETVRAAVWSQGDQNDIAWYNATKTGTNTYVVYADIMNHKQNLGQYQIHVYVADANGIENLVGATFCNMLRSSKGYYSIVGSSVVTSKQLVQYYNSKATYPSFYLNSDAPTIEDFCRIYAEECNAEGIKVEVAFAQAMKETGFLQFGGMVDISQYNFAGIGAVDSGATKPATFGSVREGIRAHVQHLKAYASAEALNQACVDPRFHLVKRGSAPYVEWLGINENPNHVGWATAVNYGYSIRNDYISKILNN